MKNKINVIIAILIILFGMLAGVGILYVINYGIVKLYMNIFDLAIEYKHVIMIFNLNLVYILGLYQIFKIIIRKYRKYYNDENK